MTVRKDKPGAEAVRRLDDKKLREAVAEYKDKVQRLPVGSEAHQIVSELVEAGVRELKKRSCLDVVVEAIHYQHILDEDSTRERAEACIGIRARAELRFRLPSHPEGTYALATISTPGLWGVEAASDPDYLREVEAEQRADLLDMLAALGLSHAGVNEK